MCVIMIGKKERPTAEMVQKAFNTNRDGAGIAWREPAEDGKGLEVVWRKGITDVEEVQELVATLPLPFVVHFRIASCGGVRPNLTHPFAVDENASTFINGRSKGDVLFHNGHWDDWKKVVLDTAVKFGKQIPDGKWSDTRAMAWLCHVYGKNFMELLGEKGVVFGPRTMEVYWGTGWYDVDGVWCSNTLFTTRGGYNSSDPTGAYSSGYGSGHRSSYLICKHHTCSNKESLDKDGYCPRHTKNRPNIGEEAEEANINDTTQPVIHLASGASKPVAAPGGEQQITPFRRWKRALDQRLRGEISNRKYRNERKRYVKFLKSKKMSIPAILMTNQVAEFMKKQRNQLLH